MSRHLGKRIVCIPDTQVRPGCPTDHFDWIGAAIRDYAPDYVVHLGDHWDMPSLSSWSGQLEREGQRYAEDVAAGNAALERLERAMGGFEPKRKIILRGNHCFRIDRAVAADARLAGALSCDHFNDRALGWEVVPYNGATPGILTLEGIKFAHYFANNLTGRPIGGNASYKLTQIGAPFVMGHVQDLDIGTKQYATGRVIRGIVAGSCLTPDHRVLTADLRYVPLGEVKLGDKLVSFDEQVGEKGNRGRRYRTGTVEAVRLDAAECFLVTLDDGKSFKVTGDHYWLTRVGGPMAVRECGSYMWRTTAQLRKGTRIPRLMDEWETLTTHEAGYLAGLYDGEGCYYKRQTTGGTVGQLTLSQKPGGVLDRAIAALASIVGADALTETNSRGVCSLRLRGGLRKVARLLGEVRPGRLLAKFVPEDLGVVSTPYSAKVVSIEPIGVRQIVRIAIDAKTMVVEGYPHHNCYLHDESYKGNANAHWRGIVVLNEVRDGNFSVMDVTLTKLCQKYTGTTLARFLQRRYRRAKERFSLARSTA